MSESQPGSVKKPGQPTPAFAVVVLTVVIASAVLAISAFQGKGTSPSPAPQTTAETTPEITAGPPLGLTADAYSCGGTAFVPGSANTVVPSVATSTVPSAAGASTGASVAGPGDPAVALAAVTARLSSMLPDSGWAPAGGSGTGIVYVAANHKTPAPFSFVSLAIVSSKWVATAYGDCEPAVAPAVTGSKLSPLPWKVSGSVDPAAPTLKMLFQSNLCGQAFVGTTVWYSQSSVTVTMWARQATELEGGAGSCSTTVETAPFILSLGEPIGTRQLRTGPASAAKPADKAPAASTK
jgi:hypothetical protein